MATIKKKIKKIKIEADKCNGCRACEVICSNIHAEPKFSSNNPARSRIQVLTHRLKDIWLPVFAGEYTPAECNGRDSYIIDGKEYDECAFCRACCPSRGLFKEPDSGLPLRCDMCEGEEMPLCVEVCIRDVLTFEEREVEVEEETSVNEIQVGLGTLLRKHGLEKVTDTFFRMTQKA
jgi:Fe-S-cluster-containing dehydrogenase component